MWRRAAENERASTVGCSTISFPSRKSTRVSDGAGWKGLVRWICPSEPSTRVKVSNARPKPQPSTSR